MKKRYFLFVCLLSCAFLSFADGTKSTDEHIVMAYGEAFNYDFSLNTYWSLSEEAGGRLLKNGSGPVRNILFELPGIYQLKITEEISHDPETCNHPQYPENITIIVSPFRMEFDFTTLRFSKDIVGGQAIDGITMSVDVLFNAHGEEAIVHEVASVNSAGVGTSIIGEPLEERVTLKPGVNTLVYRLSGQARNNTYIMFDFVDINGQPQVYNYPQKIR